MIWERDFNASVQKQGKLCHSSFNAKLGLIVVVCLVGSSRFERNKPPREGDLQRQIPMIITTCEEFWIHLGKTILLAQKEREKEGKMTFNISNCSRDSCSRDLSFPWKLQTVLQTQVMAPLNSEKNWGRCR